MCTKVDKQITKNFRLSEFTRSEAADIYGFDNTPDDEVIENLTELCEKVLQPLRDWIGPIAVTSGYRSEDLNDVVGGAKDSQHIVGEAADIRSLRMYSEYLFLALEQMIKNEEIVVDQAILYSEDLGGHLHVSINTDGNNRNELLYSEEDGVYLEWQSL